MKEVEVGLRTDSHTGIGFFGIDEVNKLISDGANVSQVEAVGAITRQQKDEDGNINIVVTGFSLIIKLQEKD